jgi:Uncharacterized protein containing caspase domain
MLCLVVWFGAYVPASAQTLGDGPRYALVIGNGNYAELGKLKNPANDASDMAATLKSMGFQVKLLIDTDLPSMEDEVLRLAANLSQRADSTGFFFYAGHGVQSGGMNYLIPADARIGGEIFLKTKALSVQSVMDSLQGARNALNVVVLDACRDNPFSWGRSGMRGLMVVGSQPPGSIVAYATSAGSVAQDGEGRNGVFTAELLRQLRTPGVEIKDVFNRVGKEVCKTTGGRQVPAVYNQFFDNAYLAGHTTPAAVGASPESATKASFGGVVMATGSLSITLAAPGTISVAGISASVPAGIVPVNNLAAGPQTVTVQYADGKIETTIVNVPANGSIPITFKYTPVLSTASSQSVVVTPPKSKPNVQNKKTNELTLNDLANSFLGFSSVNTIDEVINVLGEPSKIDGDEHLYSNYNACWGSSIDSPLCFGYNNKSRFLNEISIKGPWQADALNGFFALFTQLGITDNVLGFIGMNKKDIVRQFGQPTNTYGDLLVYDIKDDNKSVEIEIEFYQNKLRVISVHWY